MQYETKILTTKYQKPDSYGALSMPVYYTAAFEFESAKAMGDAFCGRSMAPSYVFAVVPWPRRMPASPTPRPLIWRNVCGS